MYIPEKIHTSKLGIKGGTHPLAQNQIWNKHQNDHLIFLQQTMALRKKTELNYNRALIKFK